MAGVLRGYDRVLSGSCRFLTATSHTLLVTSSFGRHLNAQALTSSKLWGCHLQPEAKHSSQINRLHVQPFRLLWSHNSNSRPCENGSPSALSTLPINYRFTQRPMGISSHLIRHPCLPDPHKVSCCLPSLINASFSQKSPRNPPTSVSTSSTTLLLTALGLLYSTSQRAVLLSGFPSTRGTMSQPISPLHGAWHRLAVHLPLTDQRKHGSGNGNTQMMGHKGKTMDFFLILLLENLTLIL